jgi:glycosyltransferase involved in cell wall biosynthesis
MGPLRVIHLITQLELGGAQQNTLYTVKHLDPSLFEPHLICGVGGILDDEARALQIPVHFCRSLVREVRPWSDWNAYQEIRNLLRRLKPDIIHTHSSKAGILGRLAGVVAEVPTIVHTYHGFGFHRNQPKLLFHSYGAAEKFACRKTDHLIFVSNGNWNTARELGLLQNCSASLIRSGVKIEELVDNQNHGVFRNKLKIPSSAKLIGMISCLKPQKDPVTFVHAADIVTRKNPSTHFVLTGDGVLRPRVAKEIAKMKYPERFHLLGWTRNVPEILADLDLVVLTSLWEGLPRIIPEAAISGVPMIASNIEGNREVITEGRNGALAEPSNAEDFARKILQALEQNWKVDPTASREFAAEFDIRNMVRKQEELYLNLSSRSHQPSFVAV